jgi:hypothetical protein
MDNFFRTFIPTMFWLGVAAFALALFMVVFSLPLVYRLTPGGVIRGADAFLLTAIAGYCAHQNGQRS